MPYTEADLRGGVAIVLGSEAAGLSRVWGGTDVQAVRLPMHGIADSLNVSTTAAVLFYEALRQRGKERRQSARSWPITPSPTAFFPARAWAIDLIDAARIGPIVFVIHGHKFRGIRTEFLLQPGAAPVEFQQCFADRLAQFRRQVVDVTDRGRRKPLRFVDRFGRSPGRLRPSRWRGPACRWRPAPRPSPCWPPAGSIRYAPGKVPTDSLAPASGGIGSSATRAGL